MRLAQPFEITVHVHTDLKILDDMSKRASRALTLIEELRKVRPNQRSRWIEENLNSLWADVSNASRFIKDMTPGDYLINKDE